MQLYCLQILHMKMEQFAAVSHLIFDIFETPQQKTQKQKVLFLPSFCQRKDPFRVIQEELSTPRQCP